MLRKDYKRLGILFVFLFITWVGWAQYTVRGGSGEPMMAEENTPYRLQVYVVNGMNDVEISYTSSTAGDTHQWYRYKTTTSQKEKVASTQDSPTTSTVRNIEEGYGYYVEEPGGPILYRYVWLMDYSKYLFEANPLRVAESTISCTKVQLTGEEPMKAMQYYDPDGRLHTIKRHFVVSYTTLQWVEAEKRFVQITHQEEVHNPFNDLLPAPLMDTEFTLRGDQFAEHFKIERPAVTDRYLAVAIEVHTDTTVISRETPGISGSGASLSSPATVQFRAYANPVATMFRWKIWNEEDEDSVQNPLVRQGEEIEYTFDREGNYKAEVEVSGPTSLTACAVTSETYSIQIDQTYLDAPNVFSPGTTPGENDVFKVVYRSVNNFKGWIFNRWGVEVFKWTDPEQGWDGKKGGKYVPPGAYYYVIEYTDSRGKKRVKKGDVNVVRSKTIHDAVL